MSNNAGRLARLSDLHANYDGILSDVWGVVHNAIVPHPSAVAALLAFRENGGKVVLITNAARTGLQVQAMLDEMGVPREAYDAIVTSGEVTRALIAPYSGKIIHHVGPDADDPLFDGLNLTKGSAEKAEAVVVTGLGHVGQTPDDFADRIAQWRALDLPFICANPDKIVEVGDRIEYCAGALADVYEAAGGLVLQAGKPHAPIYDASLDALNNAAGKPVEKARVLAIGDSARTDATGAADAGLDFLFITGSIHAAELGELEHPDPQAVSALAKPTGVKLVGFQPRLA